MLEIAASFSIYDDSLDPNELSALLDLAPDQAHRRGDPHFGKSGRRFADFRTGQWCLKSSTEPTESLNTQLRELILRLRGRKAALAGLRARGYEMRMFVGLFEDEGNGGDSVHCDVLLAPGEMGIRLDLDLYPTTSEDLSAASH